MGVGIEVYRARIGGFGPWRRMDKGVRAKRRESGLLQVWFLGVVVAVLLVIGGVEMNPGPAVEQGKIDQILAYVKNQEKDSKIIKQLVELHKQVLAEMKKCTEALDQKLDRVNETVNKIISDYEQVKESIKEWGKCQQRVDEKIRHLEDEKRKNNIIIFGLQEKGDESYLETLELTVKFLRDTMGAEVSKENIDYVTRIGRKSGGRPILVKFTTFFKKLEVWRNKKNLAGTKIRMDDDLSLEDRRTRKELIPYLKDARKRGHKAFLRKQVLLVNGKVYGLNFLKENIQLREVDGLGNMQRRGIAAEPVEREEGNDQHGGGNELADWTRGDSWRHEAASASSTSQGHTSSASAVAVSAEGEGTRDGRGQYNLRSWLVKSGGKAEQRGANAEPRIESA
jgi:hypothetical protein